MVRLPASCPRRWLGHTGPCSHLSLQRSVSSPLLLSNARKAAMMIPPTTVRALKCLSSDILGSAANFDNLESDAIGHQHAHDKDGHHLASPCGTHLTKAFEQYSAYLETARCICRSILDRGLPTVCCGDQHKRVTTINTPAGHSGESAEAEALSTAYDFPKSKARRHHHHGSTGISHRGTKKSRYAQSHRDNLAIKVVDDDANCCSGHDVATAPFPKKSLNLSSPAREKERDVEKDAGLEHVALIVDGMTCSGCGNKLERTLNATPGVSNVRVNFVLGNAEFSIDPLVNKANEVIRGVERATGFQCTRLAGADQTIDLLASGTSAKALADITVPGVSQVTIIDKKTVRVSYDPTVIGARSLLDNIGEFSEGLAPPAADPSVSSGLKRLYDMVIKTTIAAVFTIPVIVLAWGDTLVDEKTRAYVSVVLATFVQLIAVPVFYRPAITTLFHDRSIEMDMLVTISITAAYLYSIVAFGFRVADRPLETSEFFETSTLLITLVLLGRLVAAAARMRAVAAVSLRSLQSSTAVIVENDTEREVDARLLQYGDKFKILPHSRVPTDGLVVSGSSELDESMLTGESMPVTKLPGEHIIAGTVNGSGVLQAQLTRLPGKNTVTDIAELVEEATNAKPRIQDLADRVARWFVPVVTAIAVIVTIIWIIIGLKGRNESASKAVPNAITYAVAVLAVSCPCALGLAVPMVLVIAGGIAARGGVVIKSAECTAGSRRVSDVVFDKTGTLTEGTLDVIAEEYFDTDRGEAVAIAKALVAGNNHPVSVAVAKHLENLGKPATNVGDVRVVPGAGVEATSSHGTIFRAGNPHWTENETLPDVSRFLNDSMTTLLVTRDSVPVALFGLRASLRPEAAAVVSELKRRDIAVHLVSGDQPHAVESVASSVGIPPANVAAQRTPAQKRDYVASLMAQDRVVMFCGDGTNDAVAVAQADVGVQLGGSLSSSDVTRGAADVVLLAGLDGIPFLLDVSRAAFNRMVFNFAWSAIYNVLAILLAAGAFVNVRIPPAYAGLGEIVSVLPVIFAAMTMLLLKLRA